MKKILCIDFDGVISSYTSGWKGEAVIPDPPVPGAINWLWRALQEGWDVQIYSSRSKTSAGIEAMKDWLRDVAIDEFRPLLSSPDVSDDHNHVVTEEYVRTHFMEKLRFPIQKPAAFLTIDDRAICFDGDWSSLDPRQLMSFKPWNKRDEDAMITPRNRALLECVAQFQHTRDGLEQDLAVQTTTVPSARMTFGPSVHVNWRAAFNEAERRIKALLPQGLLKGSP